MKKEHYKQRLCFLELKPIEIEHFRNYIVFTINNLTLREFETIQMVIYKYGFTEMFMIKKKMIETKYIREKYKLKLLLKFSLEEKYIEFFKVIYKTFDEVYSVNCFEKLNKYKSENQLNEFLYSNVTLEVLDRINLDRIKSNKDIVECVNEFLEYKKNIFISKDNILEFMNLIEIKSD